jgi:hypothetical protein
VLTVGAPAMLKLARRWGGADVRAAALLRRADVVHLAAPLSRTGVRDEHAAKALVPPATLLVLDVFGMLHLVALRDGPLLLGVRETLMTWRPGDVRVVIQPGGGRNFRPVELRYGETVLELAGPWRSEPQRDALELIEQVTLG